MVRPIEKTRSVDRKVLSNAAKSRGTSGLIPMDSLRLCCVEVQQICRRTGDGLRYSNYEKEKLSLGDVLALDRTRLANERTFLAYLRASIMIGVSSVSIFKLLPDERLLVILAWAMLPTSLLLAIVGAVRSNRLARSLRSIESKMEPRASDEGSE